MNPRATHVNLPLIFAATAALAFILPFTAQAATCCRCQHPKLTGGDICITDQTLDCGSLTNSPNADLKGASCVEDKAIAHCARIPKGVCLNEPAKPLDFRLNSVAKPSDTAPPATPVDNAVNFSFNVDIPGASIGQPYIQGKAVIIPFLAQYVAAVQKLAISIGLIAAAIMIAWGGFRYIVSGTAAGMQDGKETIVNALIGLVLLLGSYLILANVNPNTAVTQSLTIPIVERQKLEAINSSQYSSAAAAAGVKGADAPTTKELMDYAAKTAKDANIDPCIVYAIIMAESRGKTSIGHDENQYFGPNSSLIQARLDFMRSRKFGSGKAFEASIPVMPASCTGAARTDCLKAAAYPMDYLRNANDQMTNDDILDLSKPPDYGLDWRFSHGIGASQATILPNKPRCKDGTRGYNIGGKCFTIPELITKEGAVASILAHPSVKQGADPEAVFCGYGGRTKGNCGPIKDLIKSKIGFYSQCPYNK